MMKEKKLKKLENHYKEFKCRWVVEQILKVMAVKMQANMEVSVTMINIIKTIIEDLEEMMISTHNLAATMMFMIITNLKDH